MHADVNQAVELKSKTLTLHLKVSRKARRLVHKTDLSVGLLEFLIVRSSQNVQNQLVLELNNSLE